MYATSPTAKQRQYQQVRDLNLYGNACLSPKFNASIFQNAVLEKRYPKKMYNSRLSTTLAQTKKQIENRLKMYQNKKQLQLSSIPSFNYKKKQTHISSPKNVIAEISTPPRELPLNLQIPAGVQDYPTNESKTLEPKRSVGDLLQIENIMKEIGSNSKLSQMSPKKFKSIAPARKISDRKLQTKQNSLKDLKDQYDIKTNVRVSQDSGKVTLGGKKESMAQSGIQTQHQVTRENIPSMASPRSDQPHKYDVSTQGIVVNIESKEYINENEESIFNYKDHELIQEYQKRRETQLSRELKDSLDDIKQVKQLQEASVDPESFSQFISHKLIPKAHKKGLKGKNNPTFQQQIRLSLQAV